MRACECACACACALARLHMRMCVRVRMRVCVRMRVGEGTLRCTICAFIMLRHGSSRHVDALETLEVLGASMDQGDLHEAQCIQGHRTSNPEPRATSETKEHSKELTLSAVSSCPSSLASRPPPALISPVSRRVQVYSDFGRASARGWPKCARRSGRGTLSRGWVDAAPTPGRNPSPLIQWLVRLFQASCVCVCVWSAQGEASAMLQVTGGPMELSRIASALTRARLERTRFPDCS